MAHLSTSTVAALADFDQVGFLLDLFSFFFELRALGRGARRDLADELGVAAAILSVRFRIIQKRKETARVSSKQKNRAGFPSVFFGTVSPTALIRDCVPWTKGGKRLAF